jgi:PTH1 family peptidyl-tRNA hydrolase
MVVDKLAKQLSVKFYNKSSYCIARKNNDFVLIKPMLYMNNSGIAVSEYLRSSDSNQFFIVVYDDLALLLGKIRIRENGSDGGHNGLASIIYYLQSKNFPRLRVGIGEPLREVTATDYVLSKFSENEKPIVEKVIETACEALVRINATGVKSAMTKYNAMSVIASLKQSDN